MNRGTKGSYSVLYRYVAKEFVISFIVAFFFFFFIFFINQILLYAQRILIKNVPISQMLLLVALSMPQILLYTIPFSTLSAASMVIGDLSANNETLALRAAGISLLKMFRSIIIGAMLLSLTTFIIADFLIPYSNVKFKILYSNLLRELPSMEIEPYSINTIGDISVATGEVEDGIMNSVLIFDQSNKDDKQIISATRGEITLIDIASFIYRLDLFDVIFLTNKGSNADEYSYATSEKMTYYLNFSSEMGQITDMSPSKMTSKELLKLIKVREIEHEKMKRTLSDKKNILIKERSELIELQGDTEKEGNIEELTSQIERIEKNKPIDFYLQYYRAEYHKKLALSISSLILALIAFPLSFMKIKNGRLFGFGLSLLVAALYWAMLFIGQSQIIRIAIHPLFLMWAPNAIILTITLILLLKMRRL
ncbi:MAG: YjgP/YjgQ family permease [Spirochaetia bacterium]|nr:YjgP/YjgQ family permease [Spirochaetia bacterium]